MMCGISSAQQVSACKWSWHIECAKARQSVNERLCYHEIEFPLKMWFQPEFGCNKNDTCVTSIPVPISGLKVKDQLQLVPQSLIQRKAVGQELQACGSHWKFRTSLPITLILLFLLLHKKHADKLMVHFIWTERVQGTPAAIPASIIGKKWCSCCMGRNTICKTHELFLFLWRDKLLFKSYAIWQLNALQLCHFS